MKKDDYLTTMIQVPPKQKISIQPFDLKTQREAFSVSLEGIKGVWLSFALSCRVELTFRSVEYQHIGSGNTAGPRG